MVIKPICQMAIGARYRILTILGTIDFQTRVREFGFNEDCEIVKISGNGPFLFNVNGVRLVLNHDGAGKILAIESRIPDIL